MNPILYRRISGGGRIAGTSYMAEVTDWEARVIAAGGAALSTGSKDSAQVFLETISAAGFLDKILLFNPLVPDSITAARTPLIKGTGYDSWISCAGGEVVTVNGFDNNAASVRIETGARYTELFGADYNDCGVFGYLYSGGATSGYMLGARSNGSSEYLQFSPLDGFNRVTFWFGPAGNLYQPNHGAAFSGGYVSCHRTGTTVEVRHANSGLAYAQFGSSVKANPIGPSDNRDFYLGSLNSNTDSCFSSVSSKYPSVTSAIGVSKYLTTAQDEILYDAIQAMRVSLGGGYL